MGSTLQKRGLSRYPFPTSAAVSAAMRGNRKRDTGPELRLRSLLHTRGLRFRANRELIVPGLRVRADIVFPRRRVAVFVDGCFWHSCPRHRTSPKANAAWWAAKLAENRRRDAHTNRRLRNAGWHVVRVWEHEAPSKAAARIVTIVRARRLRRTRSG